MEKNDNSTVFYYKLKNGDEIISVEEKVGFYKNGLIESVETATDMSKNEKKQIKSEIKEELKGELSRYDPTTHIELHYPMKIATLPFGSGQSALHMNFWVSPSIHPSQIMHIPESEVFLKLKLAEDSNVVSYYFSLIRRYILSYAKTMLDQGLQLSPRNKSLLSQMELQSFSDGTEEEDEANSHENSLKDIRDDNEEDNNEDQVHQVTPSINKEQGVPKVTIGNGLKKTLH